MNVRALFESWRSFDAREFMRALNNIFYRVQQGCCANRLHAMYTHDIAPAMLKHGLLSMASNAIRTVKYVSLTVSLAHIPSALSNIIFVFLLL
jgi:hypothetical protein